MGASRGGEKGKEASGDTGAGLRAGNELGPTAGTTAQSREEDKEEMTDWGGVGGGGDRNRVLLWEELKVPKNKLGWASQNICIQFQVKSRNVSECLLHTKHSWGPVLFWPCWFPSPS